MKAQLNEALMGSLGP